MATSKELIGKTPNGGVRSAIYYQDDDGAPADESVATRAEIVEYDDKGNAIFRTYGKIGPPVGGSAGEGAAQKGTPGE